MDIKIVCGCGQKYIFEVDPDNGLMPASVNCPACGADGTQEANEILTQILPESAMEPSVEPAMQTVPPPPAAALGGPLRINLPVHQAAAASSPPPPATRPPPQSNRLVVAATPKAKAAGEFSLGLGILGAVLGAGLGAGLMYGFFEWAGFRFPLMGTGIGALSGLGARILARGTDTSLGIIAAAIALLSTAGTLYLMFGDMAGMFILSMAVSAYFAYRIAA
ncbi:MAG: hypothetical protein ACLP2Y_16340 [Limisphaerales bacterium]